jgi:hypothetical protein
MRTERLDPWPYELRVAVFADVDPQELLSGLRRHVANTLRGITNAVVVHQSPTDSSWRAAARAIDDAEFVVFGHPRTRLDEDRLRQALRYALHTDRTIFLIDPQRAHEVLLVARKDPLDSLSSDTVPGFDLLPDLPRRARTLSPGWAQLETYNRDRATTAAGGSRHARFETQLDKQTARVQKATRGSGLYAPLVELIVPELSRANVVAITYRKLHAVACVGVFVLSALAVGLVVLQSQFFPHVHWVFGIELLLMSAALVLVMLGRRWHERWILTRYLTEQLRMAKCACILDLPTSNGHGAAPDTPRVDKRLPFYAGPRGWIASIVSSIAAGFRAATSELEKPFADIQRFVLSDLLLYQRNWHERNSRRKSVPHRSLRAAVLALFFATLLVALLHVLEWGAPAATGAAESALERSSVLGYWLTFAAIFFPALGGALHAIDKQMELERVATRSEGMASLLGRYVEYARDARDIDELRRITLEATRVIDIENYEWWALLSFAPPEIAA